MSHNPSPSEVPSPDELPDCLVDLFEKFPEKLVTFPLTLGGIVKSLREEDHSSDFSLINNLKAFFHPEDYEAFLNYTGIAIEGEMLFRMANAEAFYGGGIIKLADGIDAEHAVTKLLKLKTFIEQKLGITNEE